LVEQSCGVTGDQLDSWAISAYERAIIELDEAGFVEIDPASGRIFAKVLPKARKFEEWIEFHDRFNHIRAAQHMMATHPTLTPEVQARIHNITLAELVGETPDSGNADDTTMERGKGGCAAIGAVILNPAVGGLCASDICAFSTFGCRVNRRRGAARRRSQRTPF
jgi:hypothetical protein